MALKEIKSLQDLERERQRLQQEQQRAIAGLKDNFQTELDVAKTRITSTSNSIQQTWQQVEQSLDKASSKWVISGLSSLGAIFGLLLAKWFSKSPDVPASKAEKADNIPDNQPYFKHENTTSSTTKTPSESQSNVEILSNLEEHIKAALAAYETEKTSTPPSAFMTVISTLGPLIVKELMQSGIVQQFLAQDQPELEEQMDDFSNRMANELENLKEAL